MHEEGDDNLESCQLKQFAFLLVNAFNIVREMVGPFLRTKQYIAFRMIVPAICYLFVSLSISMVSRNSPFRDLVLWYSVQLGNSSSSIFRSKHRLMLTSVMVRGGLFGGWPAIVQ
jgi:hypothetical protein